MVERADYFDNYFAAAYDNDLFAAERRINTNVKDRSLRRTSTSKSTFGSRPSLTAPPKPAPLNRNTYKSHGGTAASSTRGTMKGSNITNSTGKKKKKKKRGKAFKMEQAITERLIEKWKESGIEDEGLKELFNQVDETFGGNEYENSAPNKFRHSSTSTLRQSTTGLRSSGKLPLPKVPSVDRTAEDVMRWVHLRDQYLTQLRALFDSLNDDDLDHTVEKKSTVLLMLLSALRKISIRIVQCFEEVCLQYNRRKVKTRVETRLLVQMTEYVRGMARSLDWMAVYAEICRGFLFVNPVLNPFLSTQRIDGKSALYDQLPSDLPLSPTRRQRSEAGRGKSPGKKDKSADNANTRDAVIPFELSLDNAEFDLCTHLGFIIYTLYNNGGSAKVEINETGKVPHFPKSSDGGDPDDSQLLCDYVRDGLDLNGEELSTQRYGKENRGRKSAAQEEDELEAMNSPTYFLRESIPRGNDDAPQPPFSDLLAREKREKQKQMARVYGTRPEDDSEEVGTFSVRFATTDMTQQGVGKAEERGGSKKTVLYSNSTPFVTTESPIMQHVSHLNMSATSLHQGEALRSYVSEKEEYAQGRSSSRKEHFASDEDDEDGVGPSGGGIVVKRLGNRYPVALQNLEKNSGHGGSCTSYDSILEPTNDMTDDDIIALKVVHLYKKRTAWRYWRRAFLNNMKIYPFIEYREKKVKQKIFHQFQLCLWQNHVYRSLVTRYENRLKVWVFYAGFVAYHKWCHRLKSFYKNILWKITRKYFILLARWTKNNDSNRRFVGRRRLRYIKNSFRCIRNNAVLSKYLLQSQLRYSSSLLFCDFIMRNLCFHVWMEHRNYCRALDNLEEKVENVMLKDALVRWVLLVWPPKPKITMQERYQNLRNSIEKNILSVVAAGANRAATEASKAGGILRTSLNNRLASVVQDIRPRVNMLMYATTSRGSSSGRTVHPTRTSEEEEALMQEQLRKEKLRKERVRNSLKNAQRRRQASSGAVSSAVLPEKMMEHPKEGQSSSAPSRSEGLDESAEEPKLVFRL